MTTAPQERPPSHELADLHAYVVPVSPKMLRETLALCQHAVGRLPYSAETKATPLHHLQLLLREIDQMRPLGPDGKHDNRHTPQCGCRP